jgi:Family of unknown function (DUF6503)
MMRRSSLCAAALLFLLTLALALPGCRREPAPAAAPAGTAAPAPAAAAGGFAAPIEAAQGRAAWRSRPALAARLEVSFGGKTAVSGRLLFRTDLSGSRLDLDDGTEAIWDGRQAWVYPAASPFKGARFHLLTWPYFLAAPMKLDDPGTHLEPLGTKALDGASYETARLTFDAGVGDTPDDWYVLYRDPESGRLAAMAYVVTYGKTLQEAEKEPHVVLYHDFVDLGGVTLPTRLEFRRWSEEQGAYGDAIGEVKLGDPAFVEPDLGAFDRPEGGREDVLPGAG